MKSLDRLITSKADFRDIIKGNIKRMFTFAEELYNTKATVYVDVNSVTSILFRYDKLNDESLIKDISYIFEEFIDTCIRSSTKVIFLYTSKPSLVHTTIYPDWCKNRYERVVLKNSDFIIKFLTALNKYNEINKLVEIKNIDDKHPTHYIYENHLDSGLFYVITKDFVCQSLIFYKKCIIFTGVNYIDYRDTNPYMYDNLDVKSFLPENFEYLYPIIRGDVRNEYPGIEGYGTIKTIDFLKKNKIKILVDGDYPLKDKINEYKPLYHLESLIDKYNELKKI